MKKTCCRVSLIALTAIWCFSGTVQADVISGPTPDIAGNYGGSAADRSGSSWGLIFTANRNSSFVGFDFTHKNVSENGGTINLTDTTTSTIVDSWTVPVYSAGNLHFTSNDTLHAGDVYQLTYTQTAGSYTDELFAYLNSSGPYPPSYLIGSTYNYMNADITVTNGIEKQLQGGVETDLILSSTNFTQWFAFNNLATSVPEPSSLALNGLGGFCLAIRRRKTVVQS